jgi:hypothetical protein
MEGLFGSEKDFHGDTFILIVKARQGYLLGIKAYPFASPLPDPTNGFGCSAASQQLAHQAGYLSWFGMAARLQFRVQQLPIDADFEPAPVRGRQDERFDLRFEFLEQFGRQTDGARSIVSDRAINQVDVEQHSENLLVWFNGSLLDRYFNDFLPGDGF